MAEFETNERCKHATIRKLFSNSANYLTVTWTQLKCNGTFTEVYRAEISSVYVRADWVVQVKGRDNANELWKFFKSARISQIKGRFGFKYSKAGFRKIN